MAGIVSFTEKFGPALNLKPQLNMIETDSVRYRPEQAMFRKLTRLGEKFVSQLLNTV